jgi:hypothetical protein
MGLAITMGSVATASLFVYLSSSATRRAGAIIR